MYAFVYVCMYFIICVCTYVCTYVYVCMYVPHMILPKLMHTYVHTYVRMYVGAYCITLHIFILCVFIVSPVHITPTVSTLPVSVTPRTHELSCWKKATRSLFCFSIHWEVGPRLTTSLSVCVSSSIMPFWRRRCWTLIVLFWPYSPHQ